MTTTEIAPAPIPVRPRLPLALRAGLTVVAMLVAAFAGALALLIPDGTTQTVLTHLCSAATGLGLAIALVRGIDRRPVSALGLGRPALKACVIALVVTAACMATGTVLAAALGLTTRAVTPSYAGWAALAAGLLTMLTQSFFLQAIPEEVLFRGYLVQTALGRLPLFCVTALSVLVFGVPHLLSASGAATFTQRMLFLLLPLGFALLATAFRLRTGSVWPAVAVHGGFHVSWFAANLWITHRPDAYTPYLCVVGGVFLLAGLTAARLVGATRPDKIIETTGRW